MEIRRGGSKLEEMINIDERSERGLTWLLVSMNRIWHKQRLVLPCALHIFVNDEIPVVCLC